jgi:hypothetical protein
VARVERGMSWKKLLESISESLNDHLRLHNDYLMVENRIRRRQIDGRVQLTDNECQELAEIGAKLGKKALEEIATVAKPDTILAWNRKFADHREFVCIHLDMLQATDFFNSEVWSWLGLLVSSLLHFIHLGRHHVRSLSHQTIQAMRSLVRHALELSAHGSRGVCFVKAWVRSQAIRGGEGVLGTAASVWVSRDERRPRSHATGKVVFLSVGHPRKIRDGPLPDRERLKGSVRDEHRQAA